MPNAQAQRLGPTPQAADPVRCSAWLGFFVKNKDLTPFLLSNDIRANVLDLVFG